MCFHPLPDEKPRGHSEPQHQRIKRRVQTLDVFPLWWVFCWHSLRNGYPFWLFSALIANVGGYCKGLIARIVGKTIVEKQRVMFF